MRQEIGRRKKYKGNSPFITNMTMLAVLYQNLSNSCLDIHTKRKANIIAQ